MGWTTGGVKLGVLVLAVVGAASLVSPGLLGDVTEQSPSAASEGTPTDVRTAAPTTAPPGEAEGDVAGAGASSEDLDRDRIETLVHREVNQAREREGLAPIDEDELLVEIARGHSKEMGMQGYFAHESPAGQTFEGRYDDAGYYCRVEVGDGYLVGGENIYRVRLSGRTLSNGEIAQATVQSWLDSPEHRRTMLRPQWDDVGIGVYVLETGAETTVFVTQNFC
jgi:uncharacterized protein YkwD